MFINTHIRATQRFDKFGWQTQTFCHKKVEKAVANSSQTIELDNSPACQN